MSARRAAIVLASVLALAACGGSGPTLKDHQQRAVCALAGAEGRLDMMPAGIDGIALRLVTPDRDAGIAALREAWPDGRGVGVGHARVEEPRPRLAVVIDDVGLHPGQLVGLWSLGQPLTWALLPDAPHTEGYAEWLADHGASTLVHLPMEPGDPEMISFPGYLQADQTPGERRRIIEEALEKVPDAVGVNNHMGSLLTADEAIMGEVVGALPPDLLILDSRTSAESVLAAAAREAGRPTAERTVFIDNLRDVATIVGWLEEALDHAKRHGHAVAIGHPYPETALALERFLAEHGDEVHLVPIERVTEPPLRPRWLRRCRQPAEAEDAGAPEEE